MMEFVSWDDYSEKYEFVTWDDFSFPTEWKVIIHPWFQSPPTSFGMTINGGCSLGFHQVYVINHKICHTSYIIKHTIYHISYHRSYIPYIPATNHPQSSTTCGSWRYYGIITNHEPTSCITMISWFLLRNFHDIMGIEQIMKI
jgi:hypothetical protein